MFNPWRLSGTEAVLQKIVFEIKYFYGMTYLDRCGKTVNAIMSNYPEWTLAGDQPNPQAAPLVSLDNAARFHFGTKKLDMSLERRIGDDGLTVSEVDKFAIQSEAVSAEVISQLGLNVFSRIGLRAWFVFANDSSEATEKWLNALGCYSTSQSFLNAFGGQLEATSVAVVVAGEDYKFRIAFNGVERQAQLDIGDGLLPVRARDLPSGQREILLKQEKNKAKALRNSQHAAMIDVDMYQDDPVEFDTRHFIVNGFEMITSKLQAAVQVQK